MDTPRAGSATRRRPGSSSRLSRRHLLLGAPAAGLGALALGACAQSGAATRAEKVLSISLNQAEDHPSFGALTDFGDELVEATDGRWGARVYPNESLGAQQEVVQLVSDGSVDLAVVSSTQIENLSMRFRPLNLPGVFDDIEHQTAVLDDQSVVGDLFSSLEGERRLRVLGGFTQGSRHLYTRSGPIESPDDLSGMKIRVQESDVFLAMIRAMGGSPTPMSYGEVYTALQSGVIDGAENNEISYVTQRHNEIAPYFARTNHLVGLDYVVGNVDRIHGMQEQDQEAFADCFRRTRDSFIETWIRQTEDATTTMEDDGVKITDPDPDAFGPALEDVAVSFLATADDQDLYERVRDLAGTKEASS
ncbi:TRAP transporter substrate-binding protein [Brachybacterium subflavum]|uniref:TRAP transporter substrate-binding protein n=1 Tax=Brachybacterium subflavum TaxID=2585206 RepID=UPI0012661139|nr:TRAP transporter substrate-binding protein [Brachybacterium subflavum]